MSKQRNLRKKRDREEEDDPAEAAEELKRDHLEDIKLVQKLRKRSAGIDAGALALKSAKQAETAAADEDDDDNDLMESYVKAQGNQSAFLDEEKHMEQFIEQELARRLGKTVDDGSQKLSKQELEEQELYKVPEAFKAQLTKEVSIPGLITAITEVEVSKEEKLKRIEETEAMKRQLLAGSSGR
jgi:hypothetical protein